MNTCPNCGKPTRPEAAVCECGTLLRADITNVSSGWETETMFAPARPLVSSHRIAAVATMLVIVSTVLALTWPQIQHRLLDAAEPETNVSDNSTINQTPSQSDIIPSDELLRPNNAGSDDRAFEFSSSEHRPELSTRAGLAVTGRLNAISQQPTAEPVSGANPLDAQLIADNATASDSKNANATPDCKPEITLVLKRSEPPPSVTETKQAAKTTEAKTYTLGPRGGCFFVTASGSKKYVDHSMCGSTAVAAARQ